jgi:hypothetical protein
MPVFKTIQSIFNTPWDMEIDDNSQVSVNHLPPKIIWDKEKQININDVTMWEQIYYKTGEIGIYAAWNPYGELYIIVHNLFVNTLFGVEIFYGEEVCNDVFARADELGIKLSPF